MFTWNFLQNRESNTEDKFSIIKYTEAFFYMQL